MPQIPTLNRSALNQAPTARVSPVGESLVSVGSVFTQIAVQEQAMVRNLKSAEMTRGLRGDIEDVAAGFDNRVDYENFDDDYDKAINELNAKWSDFAGGDRQLQNAFQVAFQDASLDLKKVVRAKKYQVIGEAAKGEMEAQYNQALDDYAGSSDSSERQAIRTNLEIIANSFAKDHLLTAEEVVGLMETFDNNAESVRADMMIYDDPEEALKMLNNKEFDLSPKLRQQKKEDAVRRIKEQKTADRVAANAEKQRIKEALQKAHDEEEKEIGNLFVKGDYEQALKLVQDSQLLEGDEKRTWASAIDSIVSEGTKPPSAVVADEIVKINSMISRSDDPKMIRSYVVQSAILEKEDKEQYLNKLETDLNSEVENGRKAGYQDIKDLIIPKRGTQADVLETPVEIQSVKIAQLQLDAWIDQQVKEGRSPTKAEVRVKAMQLAQDNQVSLAQKLEYTEQTAKQLKKEIQEYRKSK